MKQPRIQAARFVVPMIAALALVIAATLPILSRALAEPPALSTPPVLADCALIAGSWSGEHDGGVIEEHWTAPAGGTMSGMVRLVVENQAVFHEYLRIVAAPAGGADLLTQPGGRCPAVAFRLTRATPTEVVFENPDHGNPSLIRYTLEDHGAALVTVTEGVEKGERIIHETRMNRASLTGPAR